jgi:hypothetical protein
VEDFAHGLQWALKQNLDGESIRANVVKKYGESAVASKYVDLYNQICKQEK